MDTVQTKAKSPQTTQHEVDSPQASEKARSKPTIESIERIDALTYKVMIKSEGKQRTSTICTLPQCIFDSIARSVLKAAGEEKKEASDSKDQAGEQ